MDRPTPPPAREAVPASAPESVPPSDRVPRISSEQLLRGAQEVLIEHRGALYRLRETSLGKLILTK